MARLIVAFVVGWLGGLFSATGLVLHASAQSAKTYTCQAGDSIWNRRKYLCTRAEHEAQRSKK